MKSSQTSAYTALRDRGLIGLMVHGLNGMFGAVRKEPELVTIELTDENAHLLQEVLKRVTVITRKQRGHARPDHSVDLVAFSRVADAVLTHLTQRHNEASPFGIFLSYYDELQTSASYSIIVKRTNLDEVMTVTSINNLGKTRVS